jgi:DNA-binding MarR family transcriptional regulator
MRPSPLHLLHRAEQVANRLFEDGAAGFITPRQLAVLVAVSEIEGCNLVAVAERTGIDRATLGEIVRRMVRKGLLQKRRSRQDTRALVLRLTDEGRLLLAAADPLARDLDTALLQALPQAQREPFVKALRAVVRALEPGRSVRRSAPRRRVRPPVASGIRVATVQDAAADPR